MRIFPLSPKATRAPSRDRFQGAHGVSIAYMPSGISFREPGRAADEFVAVDRPPYRLA
jgi:hypothetical protein